MSDLISRQAAIDVAKEELDNGTFYDIPSKIEYLPSVEPEQRWIPCSERLPERIINSAVETEQEFLVTVKERWPGEEWTYHTDLAWVPGEYIDDYWQTFNDWKEGQEVHVIAWMPLPEPYDDFNQYMNKPEEE